MRLKTVLDSTSEVVISIVIKATSKVIWMMEILLEDAIFIDPVMDY